MGESAWEHAFLDRVEGVVRRHAHQPSLGSLACFIDRFMAETFEGWDPPPVELQDTYRELCFAFADGKDRAWRLAFLRDADCGGMDPLTHSAAD